MEGDKKRSFRLHERPRSLLSKLFKRSESNRSKSSAGTSSSLPLSLEETRADKVGLPQSSNDTSKSAAAAPDDSIPDVSGHSMWEDAIAKVVNSNEDPKLVAIVKELNTASALSPNDTVSTIATMVKRDLEREVESQRSAQGFVRESVEQTVSIINKFLAVGDVAASFDPVHAALPWAAVRFVLVALVSYRELKSQLLGGIAATTSLVLQCESYRTLYMDPEPALRPPEYALSELKGCITEAYYNSLMLLSFAVCYLRDPARHLKAVFKLEDMEGHVKNVLDRGRELDHAANLCERYCNLESRGRIALLHEIAQSSYETLEVLRGQRSLLLDIHQELVLSKLRIAKTAAFDHFDRNSEPECHPETRAALLRDMMRWVWDREGDSIFWLQGMAGTGKSTLSRTFARKLQKKGLLGASFFFKRGDGDRGMARMFFPTIASQLAMQLPALARSLKSALEREPDVGEKSMEVQFEKLILQPLQGITVGRSKFTAFIIIIDALDECDPESDATTIIRLLPRLKQLPFVQLKFFVTSRPEFPILLEFDKIKGTYEQLVLHHVKEDIMTHDLKVYFESELGRIRDDYNRLQSPDDQLLSDWPGQRRIELLVQLAVPLFIFAKTVCLFIANYAYSDPEEQLQRVLEVQKVDHASQLHRTYLFVLNRLLLKRSDFGLVECDAEEKEEILDNFRQIVGSLVLLEYPLSVDSLSQLLKIPKKNIRNMLNLLHSVLDVPGLDKPTAPVRILHLSFRDFLTDPKNQTKNPFWVDEMNANAVLATRCMDLLMEDGIIYEGMHKGPSDYHNVDEECIQLSFKVPPALWEEVGEFEYHQEIMAKVPPYIQYACLKWPYHVNRSGPTTYNKLQALEFIEKKSKSWIDALLCMRRQDDAYSLLNMLLNNDRFRSEEPNLRISPLDMCTEEFQPLFVKRLSAQCSKCKEREEKLVKRLWEEEFERFQKVVSERNSISQGQLEPKPPLPIQVASTSQAMRPDREHN